MLKENSLPTPNSFINHLKTKKARWYLEFLLFIITSAVIIFTIPETAFPFVYVRYILGSILVLWLPGYTFLRAVFPKTISRKKSTSLDSIEQIALSIGISIAFIPLIGIFLIYIPGGYSLQSIVLSLLFLTTMLSTVAVIREYQRLRIN
jgi:uncharacterized membrane protein